MIGVVANPFGGVNPFQFLNSYNEFVLSGTSSFSFSDVDFGEPGSGRSLIMGLEWLAVSAERSLVSASIGGVAATIVDQAKNSVGLSSIGTAIIMATVPLGASGNVDLTFSTALDTITIVLGSYSKSAAVLKFHASSTALSPTATLDIVANGFAVAAVSGFHVAAPVWTGLTQDYAPTTAQVGASRQVTTAVPGAVMTATCTPLLSSPLACGTFATFH